MKEKKNLMDLPDMSKHIERRIALVIELGENRSIYMKKTKQASKIVIIIIVVINTREKKKLYGKGNVTIPYDMIYPLLVLRQSYNVNH